MFGNNIFFCISREKRTTIKRKRWIFRIWNTINRMVVQGPNIVRWLEAFVDDSVLLVDEPKPEFAVTRDKIDVKTVFFISSEIFWFEPS